MSADQSFRTKTAKVSLSVRVDGAISESESEIARKGVVLGGTLSVRLMAE